MNDHPAQPTVGVVIPTLNEERALARALGALPRSWKALVVDGGSTDRTVEIARELGQSVVQCSPGRAAQMNLGARTLSAQGIDVLLFLHADGMLPPTAAIDVAEILNDAETVGGAFSLAVENGGPLLRIITGMANLRSRHLSLPYGDQGVFCRVASFESAGGFPDVPLMEDVALVRRLRAMGKIRIADSPILNLDRHWSRLGPVLTTLVNWSAMILYTVGVSPSRIAPVYARLRRRRNTQPPSLEVGMTPHSPEDGPTR